MLGEAPRDPAQQPSTRGLRYYRVASAVDVGAVWLTCTGWTILIGVVADVRSDSIAVISAAFLLGLVAMLGWFCGVLPPLLVRYRRYEIGEHAVFIQRGFLTQRRALVPFERIQFVVLKRGPIERRFRLATVVLQTAAGSESIALLDDEVADELQDRLSQLAQRSARDL